MGDVVEKIVRQRIYDSLYWKLNCYEINAVIFCERCVDLAEVGGLVANNRPTPFLCLVFKLVLIDPPLEIVEEMLNQSYFKYLTATVAVYVRLKYDPMRVYKLLEPFYADYRKLRLVDRSGKQLIWHVDELIDALLHEERVFDVSLPRIPSRIQVEDLGLEPRPILVAEDCNDK